MNHRAGPEADGADANAVESIPADGAAAADVAENQAGHAAGIERQGGAHGSTGEPAEPARLETGEPRVDAALTLLDRLTELPVTEHAAVFERVHAELTAVLGQLDPESAGADD